MTLIKSLLLGSAAGIVAVASAQAADLPTRKGAPAAEYVRVCSINVGGAPIVGFTLPGSDTCLKISGLITAQYTVAGRASTGESAAGFYTRGRFVMDAVSNTGAGPLLAHVEIQGNSGTGFDSEASGAQINSAFLTWAGLTAGQHGSFYDYIGGSINTWDDIISPDHSGGPMPLIAYTVSAGGGFAATVALETPENSAPTYTTLGAVTPAGGVVPNTTGTYGNGFRSPDIVGQLKLTQGWGNAQLSGVLHEVDYAAVGAAPSLNVWGYGILGGLGFNIPGIPGADAKIQGVYAHDAAQYSGLTSFGAYNYGTVAYVTPTDVALAGGTWHGSSAWSVAGGFDFPVTPSFKISPEASYGNISYSGGGGSEHAFVGGGTLEWTPVKNLVFDLDLLYVTGSYSGAGGDFNGFNGKLRIERDF